MTYQKHYLYKMEPILNYIQNYKSNYSGKSLVHHIPKDIWYARQTRLQTEHC